MRNPINNLLTPQEQKVLLYLACFFMLGGALNLMGWTPLAASKRPVSTSEIKETVKTDAEIKIDIRTATKEELILLPGIGEKRAADIIARRKEKPFQNVSEIMDIKGIGQGTYEKMKPMLIIFGDSEIVAPVAKSPSTKENGGTKKSTLSKADDDSIVNINSGGISELTKLSGIGEVKARAIIDYRKENGAFGSIEDLVKVKGIGAKTLEKIRHRLAI
ncbi:MAG: helix-hairpin-helix domain-containing protein [Candidatus Cloacimonadaceae bacterium]|nr:helix-hairpin-helix domain-containing protein [Candidatus Cloacimonadaceae bacterium]